MLTGTLTKPSGKKADPERQTTDAAVVASGAGVASRTRSMAATAGSLKESMNAIASSRAKVDKLHSKLGAEKLTPEEQRRRFIEAALKAGAIEDEADFDAALKLIAKTPKQGQA